MDFSNQLERVNRAEQRAIDLTRGVKEWSKFHPVNGKAAIAPDRLSWELRLRVPKEPPLSDWGYSFGESVHHLRSALDNLVVSIACQSGVKSKKKLNSLHFPIYQTESEYSGESEKKIGPLPETFKKAIHSVQPFHRTGQEHGPDADPLVLLNLLDNNDKHHLQVKPIFNAQSLMHDVQIHFETEEDADKGMHSEMEIFVPPLKNGSLLIRHHAKGRIAGITGKNSVTIRLEVVLDDGRRFGAIAILAELSQYVRSVIDHIERTGS